MQAGPTATEAQRFLIRGLANPRVDFGDAQLIAVWHVRTSNRQSVMSEVRTSTDKLPMPRNDIRDQALRFLNHSSNPPQDIHTYIHTYIHTQVQIRIRYCVVQVPNSFSP